MAKHKKVDKNGKKVYRLRTKLPNGKTVNVFDEDMSEAKSKLERIKTQYKMTCKSNVRTVKDYAIEWLDIKKKHVKKSTYIGYESKVRNYVITPLGDKLICDVTSDDIEKAVAGLAQKSKSFCHEVRMIYKSIFEKARKAKLIADNPASDMELVGKDPEKDNQREKSLTNDQVGILLTGVKGLPVETFIRIALGAGLRREEILALTWSDILLDVPTPRIRVCKAWRLDHNRPLIENNLKTKAAKREVPIDPKLTAFLKEKREASTSKYVIANSEGEPLSGSQWRNFWKQVTTRSTAPHKYKRKENGEWVEHVVTPVLGEAAKNNPGVIYSIDFHVTPHMLRHTFVSQRILAGVNPKTVQVVVGHANSKITMDVYAELTENLPEDVAAQLYPGCKSSGT